MLFIKDTVNQADFIPSIILLFSNFDPSQTTIVILCILFIKRFPLIIIKVVIMFFDIKISQLSQKFNKIFIAYYKYITNLIQTIFIKNKFTFFVIRNLSKVKSAILNMIIYAFIRNLLNFKIQEKIIYAII